MGQSRTENILENILGASNPLGAPQSREEALLMQLLEKLNVTVLQWLGVTTTALEDGSPTNPITINSKSVTAKVGDVVSYELGEFVFDGNVWQKLGDVGEPGTIVEGILGVGETSLLLTDSSIAINSMIDIYTDVYGLQPTNVSVTSGMINMTFLPQGTSVHVKVKVI